MYILPLLSIWKKKKLFFKRLEVLALLFLSYSALTCISQTLVLLYHNDNNNKNSSRTNFFECLLIVPGNLLSLIIKSVRSTDINISSFTNWKKVLACHHTMSDM